MKRSVLLLFAVALLLLAGALAPVFKTDPGQVLIHFRDWTVETSVLVLVIAVLAIWFLGQLLLWMWRLPVETARRVREKRALKQLEKGLLALTEGDWRTAEKALERSASVEGKTTARYLAAAQAADGQDAGERREFYLEQADTGRGKPKFLVSLTRARMLLNNGQRAAALPILLDLHARRRKHPQVLELLTRCHRELGNWDELQALIPPLRKAGVMDESQLEALRLEIARQRLLDSADTDTLAQAWKQLPKAVRQEREVIETFADRATVLGDHDMAEPVLRAALKQSWRPALVLRYGDPASSQAALRLKHCEKWLVQQPDDASLHLALGRLCAGEKLWGKARKHLIRSLEIEPGSVGYDSLGQLLERQGELELAMYCFRNALRMNQGRAPLPLPGDTARLAPPDETDVTPGDAAA